MKKDDKDILIIGGIAGALGLGLLLFTDKGKEVMEGGGLPSLDLPDITLPDFGDMFGGLGDMFSGFFDNMNEFFKKAKDTVTDVPEKVFTFVGELPARVLKSAGSGFQTGMLEVSPTLQGQGVSILGWLIPSYGRAEQTYAQMRIFGATQQEISMSLAKGSATEELMAKLPMFYNYKGDLPRTTWTMGQVIEGAQWSASQVHVTPKKILTREQQMGIGARRVFRKVGAPIYLGGVW